MNKAALSIMVYFGPEHVYHWAELVDHSGDENITLELCRYRADVQRARIEIIENLKAKYVTIHVHFGGKEYYYEQYTCANVGSGSKQ